MILHFASYTMNCAGFTNLDRSVPVVGDLNFDPLATAVDHDAFVFYYDSTGKGVLCIRRRLTCREQVVGWGWEEGTVQGVCEIPELRANGVMDSHEKYSGG